MDLRPRRFIVCTALFMFVVAATAFTGCTSTLPAIPDNQAAETGTSLQGEAWHHYPLTDVVTGKQFNVGEMREQPVLVFTFTLSCPICTRQQQEILRLSRMPGISFQAVGLDIDPNEDA